MKKIFVFLLSFVSLVASAQFNGRSSDVVTVEDARLAAKFNFILPRYQDTLQANAKKGQDSAGALIYIRPTGKFYLRKGTTTRYWAEVSFIGDIGGGFDSTAIYLALALKLNTSDTAAMLSGYVRVQRFIDSLAAMQSRIGLKLNITDTVNRYPRFIPGTNITFTGTYPNITISSTGGTGGTTDTTSLSSRIDFKLNISDTAGMLSGYVRLQRLLDSMAAVQSRIALKLNISDTAGMLLAYRNNLNLKLNISDTSGMLAAYRAALAGKLNLSDTSGMLAAYRTAIAGKENYLGVPSTSGYILSSTTGGVRTWVALPSASTGAPDSVVISNTQWCGYWPGTTICKSFVKDSTAIGYLLVASGTGVSQHLAVDSALLAGLLNAKINTGDSAFMLAAYQIAIQKNIDSLTAHKAWINSKLDTSGTYISSLTSNTDVLYNASTFSYSNHLGTITQNLASQSAYRVFGTGSSSGVPSFMASIDSNIVAGLHSQTYYDLRYSSIGGSSKWTLSGSDIYRSTGLVNIGSTTPFAKLGIVSNNLLSTTDSTGALYLLNTTAATASLPQYPPSIWLEGRTWNSTSSTSGRAIFRIVNRPTTTTSFGANFVIESQQNNATVTSPLVLSHGGNLTVLGNGSFAGTLINTEDITMLGRCRLNTGGARFNADMFSYNFANNQHNFSTNGSIGVTHDFIGTTRPGGASTAEMIFARFGATQNWSTTVGAGTYTGVQINMTETSLPTGQNYLFRAGTGGASFSSKFDITNTGQVTVGNSAPAASAALQIVSTTKGFLAPVMTNTQKGSIASPATGLTVYCSDCTATDTSTGVMQTYNGSTWKNNW